MPSLIRFFPILSTNFASESHETSPAHTRSSDGSSTEVMDVDEGLGLEGVTWMRLFEYEAAHDQAMERSVEFPLIFKNSLNFVPTDVVDRAPPPSLRPHSPPHHHSVMSAFDVVTGRKPRRQRERSARGLYRSTRWSWGVRTRMRRRTRRWMRGMKRRSTRSRWPKRVS